MSAINWERLGTELAQSTKAYVGKVREALSNRADIADIAITQHEARLLALEAREREQDTRLLELEAQMETQKVARWGSNGE